MKICILGVGRSGTTALYTLLQEIMADLYRNNVNFIYEPFLWDINTFNDKYQSVKHNFQSTDSLSSEGIYHHQVLPLFVTTPLRYKKNDYLLKIFNKTKKHLLVKFIRANGRFLLLNKICPECKFIFIIRNPVDVINSLINRFSFFGGEFHKDDSDKFIKEVGDIYKTSVDKMLFEDQISKEASYWYYMNRFLIEFCQSVNNKPLIIIYEDYLLNRKLWVKKICNHLKIAYKDKYLDFSKQPGGSTTSQINITQNTFNMFKKYLDSYFNLLREIGLKVHINRDSIILKYQNLPDKITGDRYLPGKSPNLVNYFDS